jgi:predicted lysophospholipase L1 biosynthesis ABC-type transport system permease subunit
MAGVLGAVASLVITVLVLVRLAGGLAGRARGVWRLGLAALARRPSAAVLQISGLGLGILALLLLAVVRVDLLDLAGDLARRCAESLSDQHPAAGCRAAWAGSCARRVWASRPSIR